MLSDAGVPIEQISRLVGHSGTTTTETIYRKQIRPMITDDADIMDRIFPRTGTRMVSYAAPAICRSGGSRIPSELVGVAGFEPAASSSRSQVQTRSASAAARLAWDRPSVGVRWRPLQSMAIVTHFVTRPFASRS